MKQIKITRKMLVITIISMGVFLIVYSLVRHFTGFGLNEGAEKLMIDVIMLSALGLFIYNRKLFKDEKMAKEAEEETERRRLAGEEEPEEEYPEEDENLPHWERYGERYKAEEDEDNNEDVY